MFQSRFIKQPVLQYHSDISTLTLDTITEDDTLCAMSLLSHGIYGDQGNVLQ